MSAVLPANVRGAQLSSAKSSTSASACLIPQASPPITQHSLGASNALGWRMARSTSRSVMARANLIDQLVYAEGYTEVEEVKGIRMVLDENATPQFEYLIRWKVSMGLAVMSLGAVCDPAAATRGPVRLDRQLPISKAYFHTC